MPKTVEGAFNIELAAVLRRKHPGWGDAMAAEQTGVFRQAALQPDIVVRHPGGLAVVLETEFEPARTVEQDALRRLGGVLSETETSVEQVLAVRVPAELAVGQAGLRGRIETAEFRICSLSGTSDRPARWPAEGWMPVTVDELACCIEQVALAERIVARGMEILERGVRGAAAKLLWEREAGVTEPGGRIARLLRQREGEQTARMAMAIIANAVIFHSSIAGAYRIPTMEECRDREGRTYRDAVLECWARILREINYWPIFRIASDLLRQLRHGTAREILERLEDVAGQLEEVGTTSLSDLSGRMFQRLIADRKFLATFYTLPASSALLAELAVSRLDTDWSDPGSVRDLRIADLACGTGALLGAAYQAVRARHKRGGGDDRVLHRAMMENSLVAADIMPAATHLAASLLSSAHPSATFSRTSIYTLPYGDQPAETARPVAIGSLDLIRDERAQALFGTGMMQASGTGEDREVQSLELPHGSVDVVIMNPPFTRPTNHEATDVPVPSFAGFETSRDEQRAMAGSLEAIRRECDAPAGHGNAGLASNFIDVAHAKAKAGGVVALVLPFSYANGASWAGARRLFAERYRDVTVVSICATGKTERAFSADTGMAELLVLGTKLEEGERADRSTTFVNLVRRPRTLLDAYALARVIARIPAESGSGRLRIGEREHLGTFVRAADGADCAGVFEPGLAETMHALASGELKLPQLRSASGIPMAPLGELGSRGLIDRDISGTEALDDGRPRGPFEIVPIAGVPTYPALWKHRADRERSLVVEPDSEGTVRAGCEQRGAEAWSATASRLHLNRDFQLNSQSLAACLTERPSIGGRAWPSFRAPSAWEEVVALWNNGTLGLMTFWWLGTRQQQGRASVTVSRLAGLLTLDARQLSPQQLSVAKRIFGDFRSRRFLPANEAYRDAARLDLDRALLVDLLGLPESVLEPLALARLQWCHEPSVHGGKSTRPEAAGAKARTVPLP